MTYTFNLFNISGLNPISISLSGITILCGNNGTYKSTIAKKITDYTNTRLETWKSQSERTDILCTEYMRNHIDNKAFYINNPIILNLINLYHQIPTTVLNKYNDKLLSTIYDSYFSNPSPTISDKPEYNQINEIFSNINTGGNYQRVMGNFMWITNDSFMYAISDISDGLKLFIITALLIDNPELTNQDIITIDNPEIYLSYEWQTVYAEILVLIQKLFNCKLLIITHSPHFLEAIEFFTEKYKIKECVNYYKCGKFIGDNISVKKTNYSGALKILTDAIVKLTDMKFEYGQSISDDNE